MINCLLESFQWPRKTFTELQLARQCKRVKNLVQRLMILGVGEEIELDEVKAALGTVVSDGLATSSFSPRVFQLTIKRC